MTSTSITPYSTIVSVLSLEYEHTERRFFNIPLDVRAEFSAKVAFLSHYFSIDGSLLNMNQKMFANNVGMLYHKCYPKCECL